MKSQSSDDILSSYHEQISLDARLLSELTEALLSPRSRQLKTILHLMVEAKVSRFWKVPEFRELKSEAMKQCPNLFFSEAVERAAIAGSIVHRLRNTETDCSLIYSMSQICAECAHVYKDFSPEFSPEDLDRLLRTSVLATENINTTNFYRKAGRYLDKTSFVVSSVEGGSKRESLYRELMDRLEKSEKETRPHLARVKAARAASLGERRKAMEQVWRDERFFREEDYAVLCALRSAVGEKSLGTANAGKADKDKEIGERRDKLFRSVSAVWRDTLRDLLDLQVEGERAMRDLKSNPMVLGLSRLSSSDRGIVLADLVWLRKHYPDWIGGADNPLRLDCLASRRSSQVVSSVSYYAWEKLKIVATHLLSRIVVMNDSDMALTLRAAQRWRPLCEFKLLVSAEITLESSHAPLTLSALSALAERPSNVIIPGDAGPAHDGDIWWNGAPPIARELISRFDNA